MFSLFLNCVTDLASSKHYVLRHILVLSLWRRIVIVQHLQAPTLALLLYLYRVTCKRVVAVHLQAPTLALLFRLIARCRCRCQHKISGLVSFHKIHKLRMICRHCVVHLCAMLTSTSGANAGSPFSGVKFFICAV